MRPDGAPPQPAVTSVVHLITTLSQGGAERVLSQLVPGPDERDRQGRPEAHLVVSLVTGGHFADVLRARGVEVVDLGMRPGRDVVRGVLRLARLLRERRPALVVAWMYHACLLARLAAPLVRGRRAEVVWALRGSLDSTVGLPAHTRATIRLLAWMSSWPQAIAVNSRAGREQHAQLGYRPRRWVEFPNGCDTDVFRPDLADRARVRAELGLPADAIVAISVARVHPQKDHPTLLAALRQARLHDPRLVLLLVGRGTESFAEDASGAVIALGARDDVASLLRAADVAVSSSLTEGTPNALIEAMASGLPIVATDVGDCRSLVGTCGRLVAPGRPEALAAGLLEIAQLDASARGLLGERARARIAAQHSLTAAREGYRRLWDPRDPAATGEEAGARPLEVVHIIARMNVGGPARIIADLLRTIDPDQVSQRLIVGQVASGEEDWFALRDPELGRDPRVLHVPTFGRAIDPRHDLRTLRQLTRLLRTLGPDVVQTHTAKAGLLGRIAARRAGVPRVLHTFHGHTLHGYFSRPVTAAFTLLERRLARRTDRLLTVGVRVRDDLLAAGIGSPAQYVVLPPGLPETLPLDRAACRAQLGLPTDVPVVAYVGRLTAVKRPDRFLDAAELVAQAHPTTVFLVVGDGELRAGLAALPRRADVRFLGWRGDVATVYGAADVVALSSDNEGMPVTLIEAAMAARACVSTDVGSAAEVVVDGRTGTVVPRDAAALAAGISALLADPDRADALGAAARTHAREQFGLAALVDRLVTLYRGG